LPERDTNQLLGFGKSIFLGGGAAGILSIFPGLNLLNLFFMFWIVLGTGLTIFLLRKKNQTLRQSDALLAGALSGLTAGGIFAILSISTVIAISQEQLEQMMETARSIAPFMKDDMTAALGGMQIKAIMVISIALFVLAAIIAGAAAGLVARKIFFHPTTAPHE
jgi:hypothetical protein